MICAVPKEGLLPDYLKYYMDTMTFQVPTSGIPQLTVPMISRYKIPVPLLRFSSILLPSSTVLTPSAAPQSPACPLRSRPGKSSTNITGTNFLPFRSGPRDPFQHRPITEDTAVTEPEPLKTRSDHYLSGADADRSKNWSENRKARSCQLRAFLFSIKT